MGVLTDLVVAPIADAGAVAATRSKERPWPWADCKGLSSADLASLYCLVKGLDPDEPVAPIEWITNPLTKRQIPVTQVSRHLPDVVAAEGNVVVSVVAPQFVETLGSMGTGETNALAARWKARIWSREDAAGYLDTLRKMALEAGARGHVLLVWESP